MEFNEKEIELIKELLDAEIEELNLEEEISTDSSCWEYVKAIGDLRTKIYLEEEKTMQS